MCMSTYILYFIAVVVFANEKVLILVNIAVPVVKNNASKNI